MRTIVLLIVTTAVAGVGAVYALAGHTPETPPSYTGCLNTSSGTVNDLAAGDGPADVCSDKEVEVHLGGGDLTGVTAGFGLVGGGSGGDMKLVVDDGLFQRKVTFGCQPGAISGIGDAGNVFCQRGWKTKFEKAAGELPADGQQHVLVTAKDLPFGDSMLVASVTLHLSGDDGGATCALRLNGITLDSAEFDFVDGEIEHGAATLMTDATAGAGASADVVCVMSNEDPDAFTGSGFGVRLMATHADLF